MRDMMGMMKQAQALQQKIAEAQAGLDLVIVEGSAGGGMVNVTMTAKGETKSVRIAPSLMVADEAEIVEDLVLAALNHSPAAWHESVLIRRQNFT
jgi:nucleoid-associated protein EbfC